MSDAETIRPTTWVTDLELVQFDVEVSYPFVPNTDAIPTWIPPSFEEAA